MYETGAAPIRFDLREEKQSRYITCPKKGSPRKHIHVCTQCRWNKRCKPYRGYLQPELPFVFVRYPES